MKQDVPLLGSVGTSSTQNKADWVKKQTDRLKAWCDKLAPEECKRLTFISMGAYLVVFLLVITISIFK